jgi:plastocyanin
MKTALIVILALAVVAGAVYAYRTNDDMPGSENVVCTLDAKICPDGSYVGRVGPNCEFALCPGEPANSSSVNSTSSIMGRVQTASSTLSATTSVSLQKAGIVTYTDSGFSPKTIIVAKGGTVQFINKSRGNMWIASDPHPTHNGYIGFDQTRAVANGSSWTFTFDKAGSWTYHNHMAPTLNGTVIVQ